MTEIALPPRLPSLTEQVYTALRRQIRNGAFPPEGVFEPDLARAMNVSRTPLREALFQLCREGVLGKQGRGYRLPRLDRAARDELLQARGIVEPELAALAATGAAPAQIAALQAALKAEQAAHAKAAVPDFLAANADFRDALIEAAHNATLGHFLQLLYDRMMASRSEILGFAHHRADILTGHAAVLGAVRRGHAEDADAAMRTLLRSAHQRYAELR